VDELKREHESITAALKDMRAAADAAEDKTKLEKAIAENEQRLSEIELEIEALSAE